MHEQFFSGDGIGQQDEGENEEPLRPFREMRNIPPVFLGAYQTIASRLREEGYGDFSVRKTKRQRDRAGRRLQNSTTVAVTVASSTDTLEMFFDLAQRVHMQTRQSIHKVSPEDVLRVTQRVITDAFSNPTQEV